MTNRQSEHKRMIIKYSIGFVSSLVLTFGAYSLVSGRLLTGVSLLLLLGGLALIQMIIQLIFFLHVADESRPRFRLLSFGFMTTVLVIVVGGSLWIMHHLNYNMMDMSPHDKNSYMTGQKDKGF